MSILKVRGIDVEAKGTFFFSMRADKKYGTTRKTKDGQDFKEPGIESIYMGLIQRNVNSLLEFWDCALANYAQHNFTDDELKEALSNKINEDNDTIYLINDALEVLENSGFFKQQIKTLWDNMVKMTVKGTEEEQAERQENFEMFKAWRDSITEEAKK